MLAQTGGDLGHLQHVGYSELRHYRLTRPEDVLAVSGMLSLAPPGRPSLVLGFISCQRFIGRFFLAKGSIQAVIDTEDLELAPGETWEMEGLMVAEGHRPPDLLADSAARVATNHPKRPSPPVPTG